MWKRAMISQPMDGLDIVPIQHAQYNAVQWLQDHDYVVQTSYITEPVPTSVVNRSVWYLAKSLEVMADVDAVYFCKGWQNARGCLIEHKVAKDYGITCIYEEDN